MKVWRDARRSIFSRSRRTKTSTVRSRCDSRRPQSFCSSSSRVDDAAAVEGKLVEEPELRRRQLGARAVDVRLHLARVDAQLLDLDRLAARRLLAADARRDAARTRATSSFIENGFTR